MPKMPLNIENIIDIELFDEILRIDSTSGSERELACFLVERLPGLLNCSVETHEVGDGTVNLLLKWGDNPQVFFCTHLDTVPPYIVPQFIEKPHGDLLIKGRGSCDAKGQIISMIAACKQLEQEGYSNFALLLLAGEETGSWGAKAYTRDCAGGDYVIVGEPTDGKMVTASKGTKCFDVTIMGKSCHSGYPQQGVSAIERFVDFINELRAVEFTPDPVMGDTTYNIGKLESNNAQNVLSPQVHFRLYFRTTAASDAMVTQVMQQLRRDYIAIEALGGDTPMSYFTLPDFETTTVAFGSDAPRLTGFKHRALCGAGSILVAHQPSECVLLSELEKASEQYVAMYKAINGIH